MSREGETSSKMRDRLFWGNYTLFILSILTFCFLTLIIIFPNFLALSNTDNSHYLLYLSLLVIGALSLIISLYSNEIVVENDKLIIRTYLGDIHRKNQIIQIEDIVSVKGLSNLQTPYISVLLSNGRIEKFLNKAVINPSALKLLLNSKVVDDDTFLGNYNSMKNGK